MKKAILYKISYLVEVDEEEVSDHKGKEKFWKLAWGKRRNGSQPARFIWIR